MSDGKPVQPMVARIEEIRRGLPGWVKDGNHGAMSSALADMLSAFDVTAGEKSQLETLLAKQNEDTHDKENLATTLKELDEEPVPSSGRVAHKNRVLLGHH